jgi:hypothetical protein
MKAVMRELAQANVFDQFTDWTTELLAYAKNSLTQRTVPYVGAP